MSFDDSELTRCLSGARVGAIGAGEVVVTTARLVLALGESPEIHVLLENAGLSTETLLRIAESHLPVVGWQRRLLASTAASWHDDALYILRRATGMTAASGLPRVTTGMALVAVLVDEKAPVSAALRDRGFDPLRVEFAYAHQRRIDATVDLPAGETCELWIHDDPFTSIGFVRAVLQAVFALDDAAASELATETHESGRASLGSWPTVDAARLLDEAHASARAEGHPLRCSAAKRSIWGDQPTRSGPYRSSGD
jgi:ATP-dependent Clp protease adapter protein ClpS